MIGNPALDLSAPLEIPNPRQLLSCARLRSTPIDAAALGSLPLIFAPLAASILNSLGAALRVIHREYLITRLSRIGRMVVVLSRYVPEWQTRLARHLRHL